MVSCDRPRRRRAGEALQITAQSQGSTQVLQVLGEVDVATTAMLAGAIGDAISRDPQVVVVDLSAVASFAAGGLGALLDADQYARAVGCRLIVIAGEGPAQQLLARSDVRRRLTIAA